MDLSHAGGASINDGKESEMCTLHIHFGEQDSEINVITGGAQIAKLDIEMAYLLPKFTQQTGCCWAWCGRSNCTWIHHLW